MKSYPNGPESEPTVARGIETNTVVPGGLWLVSIFQGEFDGVKFEGRGQYGYDPRKKKYVGTWVDSMSPTLTVLEGSYDAMTRTMTYTGDGVCPKDGSKLIERMVTKIQGDDRRVFTLYVTGAPTGGKEAKVMEIEYTKRRSNSSRP